MNILYIIIALMGVAVIALLINAYNDFKENNVEKISFKEAFDLTELPIITFMQGCNKYNFLLDTGSTDSHINKKIAEKKGFKYRKSDCVKNVFGMNGEAVTVNMINTAFYLNSKKFEDDFLVNDLSAAFTSIKKESGVTLHGILGSKFFEKYKYVIDFSKNVAYSKK